MNNKEKFRRRSVANFIAGMASVALALYVLQKISILSTPIRVDFYVMLAVFLVLVVVSFLYFFAAVLMRYRYMPNLPMEDVKRIKRLWYEEDSNAFFVVWYRGAFYLTGLDLGDPEAHPK